MTMSENACTVLHTLLQWIRDDVREIIRGLYLAMTMMAQRWMQARAWIRTVGLAAQFLVCDGGVSNLARR